MKNNSPVRGGQQKWSRNNEGYRIRSPLRSSLNKDEELALFHDMRTVQNKNFLHPSSEDMEASLPTKLGGLTEPRTCASPTPAWKGSDLRAIAESEKTDYDWLLTPPGTPLFPSLDKDSLQGYMGQCMVSQSYSASKGSRFSGSGTPELQRMARRSPGPRTPTSTVSSTSSTCSVSRPRASSPSSAVSSPATRPSTPSKSLGRSTTMVNRASTRSSPPMLRRTNTSPVARASSIDRNAVKTRNSASPTMKAWQAPELGFSSEPPPNLRTSYSDRPISSLGRPRIGVQEARHHQEARHSYSDALESKRPLWRTCSSSTSRLSSSTTSQDVWSSRGSIFSSSDDARDIVEPSFLDFCGTSPSSMSGTSKTVSEQLDDDVNSGRSSLSRQKPSPISTKKTARFSSASTRRSLESCMQHADNSGFPPTMFRPLMSNAPATSYCNIGRSAIKNNPSHYFVEPSVTASSNASSERNGIVFPGNESSDEEVESSWRTAATSKSELNESYLDDANSPHMHDLVNQSEQESVADNMSTIMDGCEKDRLMSFYTNTREEDENKEISKPISGSFVPSTRCCNAQEASADELFVKNSVDQAMKCCDLQEPNADAPIRKISACAHSDPVNLHMSVCGQEEIEVYNLCHHKGSKSYTANDANCENASVRSMVTSAISPLERHGNTSDGHCAEQIRMDPTASETNTNALINKSSIYSENHASGPDIRVIESLLSSVNSSSLKASFKFAGQQSTPMTIVVPQGSSMHGMEEFPARRALLLEEPSEMEKTLASSESGILKISALGHVARKEFQSGIRMMKDENFSSFPEPQGDSSSLTCMPQSDVPTPLAGEMKYSLESNCWGDHTATPEEIKESNHVKNFDFDRSPGKHYLNLNDRCLDSTNVSSLDEIEGCLFRYMSHGVAMDSESLSQSNNIFSGHEHVETPSVDDKENLKSCNALADVLNSSSEILDHGPQNCPMITKSIVVSSIDCSLVAEVSEKEVLSNSASLQNIPQPQSDLEPDSSLDLLPMQESTQTGALSTSDSPGQESSVNTLNLPTEIDGQNQPQRGTAKSSTTSSLVRTSTPSFSLEEATNTILFCSSIIHDIVYKAASIATEKETEAMKVASFSLIPQSREQNANLAFISSLRGKFSKSVTRKTRHKEANASSVKSQKEEVILFPATVTEYPTHVLEMVREPSRADANKPLSDNSKDKSFMGITVNTNCQCSIM